MKQAAQQINSTQLRQFAPLGKLSDEDAQELLRTSITVQLSPGTPVFQNNESGKQVFYLLKGEIEVRGKNSQKTIIEAGSQEARKPLGHHLPGQHSAVVRKESVLVSFDADMLDLFLNWTNPNAYVVNEMETTRDHEWMNRLLQSRGLLRFSEEQINNLLNRMSDIPVKAGEVVIEQDSHDDFYYVIKKGKATVTRRPDAESKPIKLADLREGDAFGEESILSMTKRGASVIMQEDGNLMRLSKRDFAELLAEPLLSSVGWDEALAMVATGAVLLDVRQAEEFEAQHLPDSINIPLPLLRLKMKHLNHHRKYIVYCDDGSRSSVAAFLLNRNGIDSLILDGGLSAARPYLAMKETPQAVEESLQEDESAALADSAHAVMADNWGVAPAAPAGFAFEDSDAAKIVEKTRPVIVKEKPSRPSVAPKAAARAVVDPAISAIIAPGNDAPLENPYGHNHTTRNLLIGIAAAALTAAFAMLQFNSQKTEPANVVTAAVTTLPAKTEVQTTSPGQYLSAEGELLQLQPMQAAAGQ